MASARDRGPSLADLRAIRALLERYASAVDARDLAGVGSCFTPDAIYEGSLAGPDIGAALADLETRWREYERTRHSVGCQIAELRRPSFEAHAETWMSVRQERRRDGRLESRWAVLAYGDDLVRTPAESRPSDRGWRIARRRVRTYFRLDWSTGRT